MPKIMAYDLPPLPALQAFEAAARHENFAAAAQELNLSQSAVSHRVRNLERHLGYPLFERLPRGLRLTESARAYLPSVRKAFEDILSSTSGVFGTRHRSGLSVRGPSSYMSMCLPTLIDQFLNLYPHIDMKLTSTIWADKLAMDETDIDLRYGFGHWPGFQADLLFRDPIFAVCSPATSERLNQHTTADNLNHWPMVHILGPEDYWAKFCIALNLNRVRTGRDVRVDSAMTAAEMCATSDRIALLPRHLTQPYIDSGRLVRAIDTEIDVDQGLYMLLADTTDRRKPEVVLFRDWLLNLYPQA